MLSSRQLDLRTRCLHIFSVHILRHTSSLLYHLLAAGDMMKPRAPVVAQMQLAVRIRQLHLPSSWRTP